MKDLKGYFMIIGAASLWGASATLAKSLLNQRLDTLFIVQTRTSFSCVVLFAGLLIVSPRLLRIRYGDIWRFAFLGILGLAGANFTYYFTIKESNVATAITIQYTAPLFVMAYEIWRKEERYTLNKLIAAVLSLTGCFLAVTGLDLTVMRISNLGLLTGAGSILSFTFLTIATRHLLVRYSSWTVTFYGIASAAVFWLVLNPPQRIIAAQPSSETWLTLFILAMASVLVPNLLYTSGLRYVVPTRAVITSTLEPIVAIVTAALFLGELLNGVQLVGAMLVILAIVLLQVSRERGSIPAPVTTGEVTDAA